MPTHHFVHVVDDDYGLRQTLRLILSSAGMSASFHDSSVDFLEAAPHLSAGCVLLDYCIPPPSGREVQRALLKIRHDLPVIVMTGKCDVDTAVAAMKAGAVDFIEKPFSYCHLIATLSRTLETLGNSPDGEETKLAALKVATLSKREREVLQAFETGLTTKKAAHALGISVRTVEAHRMRMLKRLGVKRLAEAVRLSVTARLGIPMRLAS
jgi:two-component system, LuxR family, response regulator FixJ